MNAQSASYCGVGVLSSIAGLAPVGMLSLQFAEIKLMSRRLRREQGYEREHCADEREIRLMTCTVEASHGYAQRAWLERHSLA